MLLLLLLESLLLGRTGLACCWSAFCCFLSAFSSFCAAASSCSGVCGASPAAESVAEGGGWVLKLVLLLPWCPLFKRSVVVVVTMSSPSSTGSYLCCSQPLGWPVLLCTLGFVVPDALFPKHLTTMSAHDLVNSL